MNSGQGDNLEEAVPESLKNILLVMADGGFITPPVDGQPRTELWDETCKRVDRFLPELMGEIFPKVNTPPEEKKEQEPAAPEKETGEEKGKENEAEDAAPPAETQPQNVD